MFFRSESLCKVLFYMSEFISSSVIFTQHTPNALMRRHRVVKRADGREGIDQGGAANPPDTFYSKPVGSTETEVFCVLFPDVCLALGRSLV